MRSAAIAISARIGVVGMFRASQISQKQVTAAALTAAAPVMMSRLA